MVSMRAVQGAAKLGSATTPRLTSCTAFSERLWTAIRRITGTSFCWAARLIRGSKVTSNSRGDGLGAVITIGIRPSFGVSLPRAAIEQSQRVSRW